MPPSEQPRVFISYARKDGAALAQRLHRDLTDEGFIVWLDVQRLTGGDIWRQEIAEAIDRADVALALLSAGSYTSDVCRVEQQRALEKSKPIIPILVQSDCEVPDYLKDLQRLDFSNPNLYLALLPKLIASIQKQAGEPLPAVSVVRYNNAPTLPENYVNRPELLQALRNTLFTEGANRNIALTAMQGMGGIGKTVLAQALCRDEVVQQAFPEGIFWFAIGKESQLEFPARIKSVPGLDRLLGPYDGEAACLAQYRDVLRKKAALIVVDDVWRASDVQPFLAESPRSRLLITTRDTSIGAWLGAREFTANLLTEAESRQVLAKWCGRAIAELPPQATDLIHECGNLPLALAMIGAQLRGKRELLWNSVLEDLRNADLQKIKAQFPEPHTTLFRAIQISVDALDESARQRYLALAVLLEDMAAAPQVQQCIWGVGKTEAAETAEKFVQLSLAQRDQPEGSIRLHDLQLDYVQAQWPREDREALDLIHGAILISSHVIAGDPGQFTSQMMGRLVSYQDIPAIDGLTQRIRAATQQLWLRPLHPVLHPPGTALIRTLSGHSGSVMAVAVTPDGQQAVSVSEDGTLKVWDLGSGRVLRSTDVKVAALTPDGQWVLSAASDMRPKVWKLGSGRELCTLKGYASYVCGVALSEDRRIAVLASLDDTLSMWDLGGGRKLRTLKGHADWVYAVAVTPDGRQVVSASRDMTLKVWDLANGRVLRTLKGHSGEVRAVAVTPDGQRAVSASSDQTLKVWDLADGRELRTLKGHSGLVNGVALSRDGRIAVSASEDQTLKVWDLGTGRELRTLSGHTDGVNAVAVTPDGRRVVSASEDQTLKVWDLTNGRELPTLSGRTDGVNAVAVTPDGQRAVSASRDQLKVWDLRRGRMLLTLQSHSGHVYAVAVTPDGKRSISAQGYQLNLWDIGNGRRLRTLQANINGIGVHAVAVAVTPDGRRAVSALDDKTLKVWDLGSGREIGTLKGNIGVVLAVAVTPDGQRVVSASWDGTLRVWDLASERELRTLCGHSDQVNAVAVTPDGQQAVSASHDKTLKLWDLASGRELRTLTSHTDSVTAVAVTPDGQRAVSASADNTVKLWNLETGEVLATFTCDSRVHCCAFSDALKLIIAGDEGDRLHFLRLEEPKAKG